jgi:Rad3-related DNA helicase
MTIMNYAYASRILQIPMFKGYDGNPFHRDLLVADECHLAESAIISAAGVKVWTARLSSAGIDLPSLHTRIEVLEGGPRSQKTVRYENIRVWIMWAVDTLVELDPMVKKARAAFAVSKTPTNRKALKKLEATWEAVSFLAHGIHEPDEWIVRRDYSSSPGYSKPISVTIQPLFGWTVAQSQLFRHFEKILLMSATPGDPDIARRHLGISEHDFTYIERPSTFPVANRPVIYWPIVKLNYHSDEQDWDKLARAIGFIATRPENLNRKGLVHSGSAANARKLVTLLGRYLGQRAYSHGDGQEHTREGALVEFVESSDPRILVTASFTTGLDLPYVIGWQVIAKIPFGSLGDEITARRRAFKLPNGYPFGQKSYEAECANTVVQACGRINRTPTDCGPTYVLDGNFDLLYHKVFIPRFFKDAFQRFRIQG